MPPFSSPESIQERRQPGDATRESSSAVATSNRSRLPQTDPNCPARCHGTVTAARKHKCSCEAAVTALRQYRAEQRHRTAAKRDADRVDDRTPEQRRRAILAVPDRGPDDIPPWPELADIGQLWARLVRDPDAACRNGDPEWWFSPNPRDRAHAKSICNQACPLVDTCLTVALKAGLVGVWGGTEDDQRAAIRAQWKRAS